MDERYAILFEPVKIGPVTTPNRFYAVPHATGHGWSQPSGAIALRGMKAEGGWGTVAVQITEIGPDTDFANHPMERIWDNSDIPRHVAQVEAIKKHGSLAAIELGHGGMRARNITTGESVIGPSALPILRPEVPLQSRQMTLDDITAFRTRHKAAAQRAISAGYDIIYVYAAHDLSILSHFLSLQTNKRNDEYGGSFENRLRLLKEVLEDTLEVAEGKAAVALRFSVAEPGKSPGLRHDSEGRDVVEALAELPDLWDVNISGWPEDSKTARFSDEGFQLPFTDFVKLITTKPVVGVGRFTSPDTMVSLIKNKRLDLIGAARPSIADPFLPNKIREGRIEEIRECIGCNICVSMDAYGLPLRCTQNATISEEWRRDWHPEAPAISKGRKSHLVIGAGPAGLECATVLMKAGQHVTVVEKEGEAGGRTLREAKLPGLASWNRVHDHRLYLMSQSKDAELFLNSNLAIEEIAEFDADTITLATGAKWRADGVGSTSFEPLDFSNMPIFTPDDVMDGVAEIETMNDILVYDDDHFYMASVLAEKLAMEGKKITFATPLPMIATWTDFTLDQSRIIERLVELGVKLMPNVKLSSTHATANVLTGEVVEIEAKAIVFVGARIPSDNSLITLKTKLPDTVIEAAGDCLTPGIIQAAVLSGHTVARQILDPSLSANDFKREQIFV